MKSAFRIGEWLVEPRADQLVGPDETIRIEPRVMQVLVYLADHAGEVVTREEIIHAVWEETFVTDEVLTSAILKLRRAFGDEGVDPKFIQTIPKKGYRLNASVTSAVDVPGRGRTLLLATAGLLAAFLALAIALNLGDLRDRVLGGASPKPIESIAVLPLQNLSGDPEQEYFVDGMTDALITDLAKIGALKVISRTSAMRYKETTKSLPEIARELNVDGIVEGSVLRSGQRVRITVQLIGAETDRNLWAEHYERDLRDILTLQGEVARAIAGEIRIVVTPEEEKRLATAPVVNPVAHEAYLKGRYFWNKGTEGGSKKSIEWFQRAIEEDPNFALAHATLAESYVLLSIQGGLPSAEGFPKARSAATTALELDDTVAEAHTALAEVSFHYEWDWEAAERELERTIQLNPGYAAAYARSAGHLVAMGRLDEALAASERSRDLDPVSIGRNSGLANTYYRARQYERAIEQSLKTLDMDANDVRTHIWLGDSYSQKGMHEEAVGEFQKAITLSGGDQRARAGLGRAYALAGRTTEARQVLDELKREFEQGSGSAYRIASIHAVLGEQDQAFALLNKAYEARDGALIWVNVEPWFDSLRSDPRFQDLLRRMNFPE